MAMDTSTGFTILFWKGRESLKVSKMLPDIKSAFSKKNKKTKRNIILTSAVILAVVVFGVNSWVKASAKVEKVTYRDVKVERRDITVTLTGTGTIQPVNQYVLNALVSGEILSADFKEGDIVKKGDLLFKIETGDVENSIQKAQVAVDKAQKNYEDTLETKKNLNVTSDIGGTIQEIYVDVGDTVSNGAQIAHVVDSATMLLEVPFNSNDAEQIRVGQSAAVTLDGSFEKLNGTVTKISGVNTVLDGNMIVRNVTISVKNPGALTVNTFGTAVVGSFACNTGAKFKPLTEQIIKAKASGDVSSINFTEGERINSGTVVVTLTNSGIDTQISTAKLSLQDAQLSLDNTNAKMDNYNITSPIAGTVITKDYKAGDTIDNSSSSKQLAVIYDMSSLVFTMPIDELDVGRVKVGQTVEITASALEGQKYTGTVDKINIKGTTSNGVTTYPVTVVIAKGGKLLPGMNINSSIVVESRQDVLAIPVGAVTRGNLVLLKDGSLTKPATAGGNTAGKNPAGGNAAAGGSTAAGGTAGGSTAGGSTASGSAAGGSTTGSKGTSSVSAAPKGYSRARVELGINDKDYIEVTGGLQEGDTIGIIIVKTQSTTTTTNRTTGPSGGMVVARPGG